MKASVSVPLTRICPETGRVLNRDSRPMTLTYQDHSVTISMPGWYPDDSDEGIHSSEDMKHSDRALKLLKTQAEGLLAPDEIRRIRKKLRLTQIQAGEIIGGGPRAFQKYEAGDLLPSRAISSALVLLDHNPKSIVILNLRYEKAGSPRVGETRESDKRKVVKSRGRA